MGLISKERGLQPPSERERLIEALIEAGCERGAGEITVEELLGRSGVSSESFERHFGEGPRGLEECMLAAEQAIIGDVMAAVSASYEPDRSEWESGIAGMLAILEYMAVHPKVAYFGYVVVPLGAGEAVRDAAEAARRLLAAMIDRLRETAEVEAPRRAARAALGSADGLVRREIAAGRAAELPVLLPELVYGATVPFLGQAEAMRLVRRARELLAESRWG